MHCSMPGLPVSWSLPKFMSIESMMLSNHLIFCRSLLLLLSIFPASESFPVSRLFASHGQKYCSFKFSLSPSCEYSELISFKIDWFDLFAVQGTLKSLLQHHSLKASILGSQPLYGSTLTSVHDYWKDHSFDYMDICWQSDMF